MTKVMTIWLFYVDLIGPLIICVKLMVHLSGRFGHTGPRRCLGQNLLFVFLM